MTFKRWGLVFSPDSSAGGGAADTTTTHTPTVADTPKPATDVDASQTPEALRKKIEELEKYTSELRRENEKHRKGETDAIETRKKAEQAEAEKRGEWERLATERAQEIEALKAVKEKADKFEAQIKALNEARINRIPEAMRVLVPTGYTPEALAEWLDKSELVLVKPQAPTLDAGEKGEKGKRPLDKTSVLKRRSY